jgi:dienelactone hydrolase
VALFFAGAAQAGEFVQFPSGKVTLVGYMARHAGPGPFPAVVLLHGCGGYHSSMMSWTDRLAAWGYVALSVDSFGPRKIETACNGAPGHPQDAFAALHHLVQQPFVRADAVALMGFSLGGMLTLTNLEVGSIARLFPDKFRAGIAFYPICFAASGLMPVPTLVLIGRADTWTPATDCEDMVAGKSSPGLARLPGDRSKVKLIVYPGAPHGFDVSDLMYLSEYKLEGRVIAYDDVATKDAIVQVRAFLKAAMKD